MKRNIKMLAGAAGAFALAAALPFALGQDSSDAYIESYRGRTDIPVPVSIVRPAVDPLWDGDNAVVEFTVDTAGRPEGIEIQSTTNADLGQSVLDAVSAWRFQPAYLNGAPVARRVILPVMVSD